MLYKHDKRYPHPNKSKIFDIQKEKLNIDKSMKSGKNPQIVDSKEK